MWHTVMTTNSSANSRRLGRPTRRPAAVWTGICLALLASWTAVASAQERDSMARVNELAGPHLPPISPPAPADIQHAIDRGVEFLLQDQNRDGSWGTPERTKDLNIFAPVPGAHHAFRTAVTSLCVSALIEIGSDRDEVQKSIDRGEAWLFENLPKLRRADPVAVYNVWGHGYAILALVRLHRRHADDPARQQEILDLLRSQYDYLDRYESVDGGWGYYDFRVGSQEACHRLDQLSLCSCAHRIPRSAEIGAPPPERLTQRAIASIYRQQKPDFSYLYGEYLKYQPSAPSIDREGASAVRRHAIWHCVCGVTRRSPTKS